VPHLFEPLPLRSVTLANRIVVSPMCQYSCENGVANDWHFVHLGSRAVGGAALVLTEATAVTAEGRISPQDLGLYLPDHVGGLSRIVSFIHSQRTLAGIQLAHSGRKGSTGRPWEKMTEVTPAEGGWQPIAPTARPFQDEYPVPRAMTAVDIRAVVAAFATAAARALDAGFDVIELHAAHGYLIHEFLSPLVNDRRDEYGGSFDNRVRLCLEVVDAIRRVWPERLPLFVRLSATDWTDGGWDVEQSIALARLLGPRGVDLLDCSSGGGVPNVRIPLGPAYQTPFAEQIRLATGMPTGAVGLITEPAQADEIIQRGRADVVLLARELLRDPYFPLRAARELGHEVPWPAQYLRSAPPGSSKRS
jgi:2,4-dienoyl-CoA reductase-like NADH-dependent reductase (Old Yellow Enzyme family)